jgi:hypothetical protein
MAAASVERLALGIDAMTDSVLTRGTLASQVSRPELVTRRGAEWAAVKSANALSEFARGTRAGERNDWLRCKAARRQWP